MDGIQVKDGESICEFNTRFQHVYHRLKDNHKPSGDIIYEWYVCSLRKSIAMFVAQKGIIDFEQACERAQSLEKDFKRYSHDLSSSLFFDNNDNKDKGDSR